MVIRVFVARTLLGILPFMTILIQPVYAVQAWRPVLKQPPASQGYRGPTDSFVIPVPSDISIDYLKRVTLELDNVDVTSFVKRVQGDAVFTPLEPLQYGHHQLRMVYYSPDGDIDELANWTFDIRQSRYYRQAAIAGSYQLNLNHRISDKNIPDTSKQTYLDGSARIQAAVADGNWQVNGNMSLVGNDNYQALKLKREADISGFQLSGQGKNLLVTAGDQALSTSNLALGPLQTRGVTATLTNDSKYYGATAFAMTPTPLSGSEGGLGISNPDQRINGVTVSAFPFTSNPEKLFLQMTYLQGSKTGGDTGASVVGDMTAKQGRAWSIVSDSKFDAKQLRLRMEYADANLQTNVTGADIPVPELQDSAYSLLTEYTPTQDSQQATPGAWKLSLLNQHVGRDYSSIANSGLPRDKNLWQLTGELTKGSVNSRASISSEYDNVDNDPDYPRVQTNRYNLSLNYSPQLDMTKDGKPIYGFLGQQSYQLMLAKATSADIRFPSSATVLPVDTTVTSVTAIGTFSYRNSSWSAGYGVNNFSDLTHVQPDYDATSKSLSANFVLGKLNITPTWQDQLNDSAGMTTELSTLTLDVGTSFFENKLAFAAGYSRSDNTASDGTVDTRTSLYKASLEWRVRQPEKNKAGLFLRLSGSKAISEDNVAGSNADSYQVFISGSIGSPFGF